MANRTNRPDTDRPAESGSSPTGATPTRVAGLLLLAVVLLPFIVFAVPQLIGAQQSFVVASSSMSPAINAGDAVVVEAVPPGAIETGTVITFRETGGGERTFTTHRVIEVVERNGNPAFRTQGDANEDPDPGTVPASDVVGRVTLVIPFLGRVVAFAQSTLGRVLLIGVPVTLLIASEVWDLFGAYRADQDRARASSPERNSTNRETATRRRAQSRAMAQSPPRESSPDRSTGAGLSSGVIDEPGYHLVTDRPPEELPDSELIGELRDIEIMSEGERREYDRRGWDIERRRADLMDELDDRIASLEAIVAAGDDP